MTKPAIEVRNLGKKFIINHRNKASYSTIKDDIGNIGRRLIGKDISNSEEEFWALKDVSFDVPQGEIFGVIGKNGSGKSTLLKTLSRIIAPTEGNIIMRGNVASLLEVGTGFHPELTGRENVYFNGSMLGMKRSEISRKFQEIVDFSEIEKFIDTPVKFYSSGMYVRLAFAVAAHLEPEILILDEVLAVGDASFQKKSMNKILSTMKEGRTVLFVSHNVGVIRQLCTNGILLNKGHVEAKGKVADIIDQYVLDTQKDENKRVKPILPVWTGDKATDASNPYFDILSFSAVDENHSPIVGQLDNSMDHYMKLELNIKNLNPDLSFGYVVWDEDARTMIYQAHSTDSRRKDWLDLKKGPQTLYARVPRYCLNAGRFRISMVASLYAKEWIYDPETTPIRIELSIKHGIRDTEGWTEPRGGFIAPIIDWHKK
jgi:lipopolysaccharide transport system ATP-binding protein